MHFTWSATGTTLWFGVGTDDASAEPFGTFPTTHEMDFNYQCGQDGAQQRYTITVQGEVSGALKGSSVNLNSTSRVDGDIVKQTLSIDEGAQFDGSVRRANDTREVTPDLG